MVICQTSGGCLGGRFPFQSSIPRSEHELCAGR
jgi:hypothetical protein